MIHDRSTFENTYDLPGKYSGDEGAGIEMSDEPERIRDEE